MKKSIVSMFLCFVFTLLCFSSCAVKAEDAEIEFSYSLNQKYFFTGDAIELTVTATNVGESCNYNDVAVLFGGATLRYASVHKDFTLSSEPVSVESEASESIFKIFKNGDSIEAVYRFTAEEACPHGFYDVEFLFDGNTESYSKAVKITEELTEEEAKVREITDMLLLEQYKEHTEIDNLSDFDIDVSINEKNSFALVSYVVCIYGYSTSEFVHIKLNYNLENGSLELDKINSMYLGFFSKHLHCFTEEKFYETQQLARTLGVEAGLYVDDGYLCFCSEKIVHITPENPDEPDHVHKIIHSRICPEPHP